MDHITRFPPQGSHAKKKPARPLHPKPWFTTATVAKREKHAPAPSPILHQRLAVGVEGLRGEECGSNGGHGHGRYACD